MVLLLLFLAHVAHQHKACTHKTGIKYLKQ